MLGEQRGVPNTCGERTYTITGGGNFLTFTPPADPFNGLFLLSVQTSDINNVGDHPIQIDVALVDMPSISVSVTFNVIIWDCKTDSVTLQEGDPNSGSPPIDFKIGDELAVQRAIPIFEATPDCGFPIKVTTYPASASWFTIDGDQFYVFTDDESLGGLTKYIEFIAAVPLTS